MGWDHPRPVGLLAFGGVNVFSKRCDFSVEFSVGGWYSISCLPAEVAGSVIFLV